jgi:uncharacterized membrane protein
MTDRLFLDATIRPNGSLAPRGRAWLIGVVAALELLAGVLLFTVGAGAVLPFLLLPVAAVILALWADARRPRTGEYVRVDLAHVRVSRVEAGEERTTWLSPTAFTRVELLDEGFGAGVLKLKLSDRETIVAAALGRPEREIFAKRLERAILRARSGRG